MIIVLRAFFVIVLIGMLSVTSWASTQVALWRIPDEIVGHPWFIATLFDAYFGFLTFFCWVCCRSKSTVARIVWLIAILLLGNIAMAIYMLVLLFRLPAHAGARDILLKPETA